jgi:hypothetical protein
MVFVDEDDDTWKRYRLPPTPGRREDNEDTTEYVTTSGEKGERRKAEQLNRKREQPKRTVSPVGGPPPIAEKFDPYASVPTKSHDTVTKQIIANSTKSPKRAKAVTDPAKLTPMAEVPQTPEMRAKIAADKAASYKKMTQDKQQGTENGS